jgi:hypothetical protein
MQFGPASRKVQCENATALTASLVNVGIRFMERTLSLTTKREGLLRL